jgi:phage major head subunit gpT-like protein
MIINSANLAALRVGFKTIFQGALSVASSDYARIVTTVPSTAKEETYGWLGKLPRVREWIGDRVVQNLSEADYKIKNRSFELTVGVKRTDIEDDNLGTYNPLFQEMGQSTGAHTDELVFGLLKQGFTTTCFDGQNFFDTDHPVISETGQVVSVANTDGGSGTPWYLLCTKRPIKPIIFQKRKDWNFVAKDAETDDNVFEKAEYVYGSDARMNAGFSLWQLAWGSKQPLTPDTYGLARASIMSLKGDHGRPLGLVPDLLVVPPSLERAARKIVASQLVNGGETNEWAGTAEVLMTPWLA